MTQDFDYQSMMNGQDTISAATVLFSSFQNKGKIALMPNSRYSFIFVLQGELSFSFVKCNTVKLKAGEVMVVDKDLINYIRYKENTTILEYEASRRMIPLMKGTSKAFNVPCSEVIPLNDGLKTWCKNLFVDLTSNVIIDREYLFKKCSTMTSHLLCFPKEILGTLYIPLYACTLQCSNCGNDFVKKE